ETAGCLVRPAWSEESPSGPGAAALPAGELAAVRIPCRVASREKASGQDGGPSGSVAPRVVSAAAGQGLPLLLSLTALYRGIRAEVNRTPATRPPCPGS